MKKCILIGSILLLTGCFNGDSGQVFIEKEEEVVKMEEGESYLLKLQLLEERERDLYKKIIEEGKENITNVYPYVTEAMIVVDESMKELQEGYISSLMAYKFQQKQEHLMSKIKDKDLNGLAMELTKVYEERYNMYTLLYTEYNNIFIREKELYMLLKKKDTPLNEIIMLINNLDEQYESLNKHIETFNEITNKYNQLKKSYYEVINK